MDGRHYTHLIAVGACYIDTILSVPAYPSEDAKQRASAISKRRGGNCPNTVEVLQQLLTQNHDESTETLELILLSTLPAQTSPDTKFILDSFSTQHDSTLSPVNLEHIFYRPDIDTAASSYIVHSKATNSRTIVNHNALDEMTLSEFQDVVNSVLVKPARGTRNKLWIHFEGRIPETTLQCMTWLRELSSSESSFHESGNAIEVMISVECEKPQRLGLEDLAELADVVFYSRSWAEGQGYTDAEGCLVGEANRIQRSKRQTSTIEDDIVLCCTWGEVGASVLQFSLDGDRRELADSLKDRIITKSSWKPESGVLEVVDTIGAGDTWIAGMLYGFLERPYWGMDEKVEFANELAGRKISRRGFAGLGLDMKKQMRP